MTALSMLATMILFSLVLQGPPPARGSAPEYRKYLSADGITIPDSAEGIPDANLMIDVDAGKEARLSLTGKTINALLDLSGTARYTFDGKLARGTAKLKPTQITTTKKQGTWHKITAFGIDSNAFLLVTDETGSSYRIKLAPGFRGVIEEVAK